jgi:hypothetical protein
MTMTFMSATPLCWQFWLAANHPKDVVRPAGPTVAKENVGEQALHLPLTVA